MENRPASFVTAVNDAPVALFFATTSAPGMTPFCASTTRPDSVVDEPVPWAKASDVAINIARATSPNFRAACRLQLMKSPSSVRLQRATRPYYEQ